MNTDIKGTLGFVIVMAQIRNVNNLSLSFQSHHAIMVSPIMLINKCQYLSILLCLRDITSFHSKFLKLNQSQILNALYTLLVEITWDTFATKSNTLVSINKSYYNNYDLLHPTNFLNLDEMVLFLKTIKIIIHFTTELRVSLKNYSPASIQLGH